MKLQLSLFAIISTGIRVVDGHGLLTVPPSKNGGTVSTPHESSTNHFSIASYGIIDKAFFDNDHSKTPWTRPGEFDHKLARDLIPGHPQTLHPCGCNAGSVANCAGVVQASGFGETTQGDTVIPPTWARGSTQETAWNAWVNHAGGHIYMLCRKSEFDSCRDTILPADPLYARQDQKDAYLQCVWDCFESNTLEWDDDIPADEASWSQKLQFRDDHCTYATMEPTTKVGKNGHLWRYTPIPDSLQVTNGGEGKCTWDSVTSFSNPTARENFIASFGDEDVCDWGLDSHAPPDWHVFDKVKVPLDLEEGEYLLSWRWEAYMADQMWTNCADVIIAPPEDSVPASSLEDECLTTPSTSTPTKSPVKQTLTPTRSPMKQSTPSPESPPVVTPQPTHMSPPTQPSLSCPSGHTGLHPHDGCTKYHHCLNGQVVGNALNCPAGTLFDVEYKYCNWESLVTCQAPPGQGCYSNNYRDCNHPDFQTEDASCDTIWLPNGSQNSCVALWGSCTNQGGDNNCCDPAVCYQGDGGSYAQCIVPP